MKLEIPIVGGEYKSRSSNVNAQECMNLYPDIDREGAVVSLQPTPGLKVWLDIGVDKEVRGLHIMGGYVYAVIGDTVYKIASDLSYTIMAGNLNTDSGHVFMEHNIISQLMIVGGDKGYILSAGTLTEIADPDFVVPSSLTQQDGYAIVTEKNTQKFWISGFTALLPDWTVWSALEDGEAQVLPDNLIAIFSDHKELWAFGGETIEQFYNSGNVDFPFTRLQNPHIENGLGAVAAVAKLDNSLVWLDQLNNIRRAEGYTPIIISTPQISYNFEQFDIISDAKIFSYTHEGHSFGVITFPHANKTYVYDSATQLWHRRSSFPANGRWRANCYVNFNRKHLVGDYDNGKIYELDHEVYTDDDKTLKAIRTGRGVNAKRQRMIFNAFELHIESGVGLAVGTTDPQIMLKWSDDGGHTWSNEHWTSMGQIGEYTKRVRWTRLGISRDRIFKVEITDPVDRVIIAAFADITVCKS